MVSSFFIGIVSTDILNKINAGSRTFDKYSKSMISLFWVLSESEIPHVDGLIKF